MHPSEDLKVGVNLGILFSQDLPRTETWDVNKNLDESIMGFFIALKFHSNS